MVTWLRPPAGSPLTDAVCGINDTGVVGKRRLSRTMQPAGPAILAGRGWKTSTGSLALTDARCFTGIDNTADCGAKVGSGEHSGVSVPCTVGKLPELVGSERDSALCSMPSAPTASTLTRKRVYR